MGLRWIGLVILVVGLVVGCEGADDSTADSNLTVFAAASLTEAFTEVGQVFESQSEGVTVVFSFGSSSELAAQLAEGAEADVFASANQRQMENVVQLPGVAADPVDFLTNSLVVIVPADNPAGIETLKDLAQEGVQLVSALPDVPIRGFTEEMLDKATAVSSYGADFKTAVLANLVSEETNVRQVVAKIALGEADAAVVYKSDVTPDMAEQVQVVEVPADVNITAVYPIVVLNDGPNPETAQAFVQFVLSDAGQAILGKWGFGPVNSVQ